jgi:hypothetical protein
MVGYNAGLTGKRSLVGATIVTVTLSAVLTLVIDLDRPTDGLITVSQAPMVELQLDIRQ